MKKSIIGMLSAAALLAVSPALTSCSEDRDSNPTLAAPTSFVLNVPAYATDGNIYDLSKSETLHLTTTQPAYGYTAATVYAVETSLTEDFASYNTLKTTYNSAAMDVDAIELNNAIVKLYQASHNGEDPTGIVIPAYLRLKAHVFNSELGTCYSNAVKLPKVVTSYVATIPSNIFVAGSSIRNGESAKSLAPVYGSVVAGETGEYYGMVYMKAGSSLKWEGDSETPTNGYQLTSNFNDNANAGLSESSDGGIQFANAGWYVLHFTLNIEKNAIISTLQVDPAQAGVLGAAWGGQWKEDILMTAPADASGQWESPEATSEGELRAYIKVQGYDWWKTEFTINNKSLYWRAVDIPNNWAESVGAAYSVTVKQGQKLYVDFDNDKAEVK